jgi:hypothetical protein
MSFNALTRATTTAVLQGDGWYPDIPVAEFVGVYRLPAEYSEGLVSDHLALAVLWARKQLAAWRAEREAEGVSALADLAVSGVPGGAALLYKRAVYSHAKALLLGQFATVDRREAARNEAKEGPDAADRFYAWAQNAVTDLLGQGRTDVALI